MLCSRIGAKAFIGSGNDLCKFSEAFTLSCTISHSHPLLWMTNEWSEGNTLE